MKKNVMMRAAGTLLIAVMLTTSVVSGTYAKYVTSDSANDTARVAKFGVVASVSGDLFGSSYKKGTDNTIQAWSENAESVAAATSADNVVAPGTKNDKGMTISVTGTPEVSTSLTLEDSTNKTGNKYVNSDIVLNGGEYGVMVEYTGEVTTDTVGHYYVFDNENGVYSAATDAALENTPKTLYQLKDVVNVTDAYKPIKWKVGTTEYNNVEAVKTAVAFINITAKPNENLSTKYGSKKITWEWPFETGANQTAKDLNNKKDTILGDMIAYTATGKYTVVKKNANKYDVVKYATISAAANSANEVTVAYTGATEPTAKTDASVCACLTVSFGAKLTVTQVD